MRVTKKKKTILNRCRKKKNYIIIKTDPYVCAHVKTLNQMIQCDPRHTHTVLSRKHSTARRYDGSLSLSDVELILLLGYNVPGSHYEIRVWVHTIGRFIIMIDYRTRAGIEIDRCQYDMCTGHTP